MSAAIIVRAVADLADAFKRKRALNGVGQGQLAAVVGLSRFTVTDIESQAGDPKLSTAIKVAEALGYRIALVPVEALPYLAEYRARKTDGDGEDMEDGGVTEDVDLDGTWSGEAE